MGAALSIRESVEACRKMLVRLAHAYGFYYSPAEDRTQAMRFTCKAAIRYGCRPVAAWVNRSVQYGFHKSPAMAFEVPGSETYIIVLTGGVAPEAKLDKLFDPKTGRSGWDLLPEADIEHYLGWGRSITEDEPVYEPFAGMHAAHSREARLMLELESMRQRNEDLEAQNRAMKEALAGAVSGPARISSE